MSEQEQERPVVAPEYALRLVALFEALVGRATLGERLGVLVDDKTVVLAANATCLYEYGGGFASIAVVNPNNFPVYLGHARSDAKSGGELVSIPAASWIVLPLRARQLGLGAGANAGSVHVLAFALAQPFAAGALGAAWAA